ncbi:nucleoside recognition protein [Lachnospiraceae bacterium MD1]|uniref:Nucleoside recognition protein n=1 Tax=Variimorphobacter saccharofermentans TaxID=2755051 RepID=A0A839JUY2_9FIRM|nr:nucleoside recognition protein [Variimorphobacter saccharofermentans]MBB2181300.1 nucleoside recognition protein [Variimorphobacter saccharofermentans]
MLNYLWAIMILLGITVGILQGEIGEVSKATINSSREAVSLAITMLGIVAMWTGIMQVAKKCGLVTAFTKALRPFIHFLFPDIPKDHIVNEYIASNMIANILGLGWAATPMGLMAIKELKKLNHDSEVASCDMCTLLIINISSLQLIPVNIIAYRSQYGSANPAEILVAGLISTMCSTAVGIVFAVVARKLSKHSKIR